VRVRQGRLGGIGEPVMEGKEIRCQRSTVSGRTPQPDRPPEHVAWDPLQKEAEPRFGAGEPPRPDVPAAVPDRDLVVAQRQDLRILAGPHRRSRSNAKRVRHAR